MYHILSDLNRPADGFFDFLHAFGKRIVIGISPDDPGLCLLLRGDGLTLSVYVDDTGGFQVFTGDDTESSVVYCAGIEMTCVSGRSGEGDYRIYTWPDLRDQVQFYFLITGSSKSSRRVIENIMDSIVRK